MQIAVVGLGYVGLDLALHLAQYFSVLGYDFTPRIHELKQNHDHNQQFSQLNLKNIHYTDKIEDLKKAQVFIICVPTPVLYYKIPDLEMLNKATHSIAHILKPGDTVIYESSVYPGTTSSICLPLLEKTSKLKEGVEFFIGYSPERVNPADKKHTLKTITKLISAKHETTLELMKKIYGAICNQIHVCSSIEIAEASKILENVQRDVNIATMNEFTTIMHHLDIDTQEVIHAAATKYNFIPFQPGLVGGHCISIDPEYLVFLAHRHGLNTPLMSSARTVNDNITLFIRDQLLKLLLIHTHQSAPYRIGIFGITYKPNVPDTRNSLVFKWIKECLPYPFEFLIHDPFYEHQTLSKQCPFPILGVQDIQELDACLIFVGHDYYKKLGIDTFFKICKPPYLCMDVANLFYKATKPKSLIYWHL